MRRTASIIAVLFACVAALASPQVSFAQTLDVIRGRVTGPDTMPAQGVTVKATSYSGNVSKKTTTDKKGNFSITYPNGEGDYWLEFSAIGFQAKRFEVKRVGDEPILLADTRLASSIATLDAVNVKADGPRALVNRNAGGANVGGGDKVLSNSTVSPDQMGNLAAMAASLPGIQLIPGLDGAADVFSALGLSADQNSTTFNGLGSGISTLPADAQVQARVATYTYDPSRGNFSGGQIQVQTQPGSNYSNRQASTNAITPQLEFADEVADAQNKKYTNLQFGAGGRGPITMDKHFYNSAVQYSKQFSDLPSLLNTSPLGLTSAGVARDSVTRLLDILSAKGIPASVSGSPKQIITDRYSLLNNIDITPSTNGTGNGITIGMVGNYSKTQQVVAGNSILTTPAHNGEAQNWSGLLSLRHSNYFWDSFLSTTNLGYNFSGSENAPYLKSPSGNVRINSGLDDSTSAVRSLSFGGNPFLDASSRSYLAELQNSIQWYAGNNRHQVQLTTDLRHERFTSDQNTNTQGSFSFNSLADLEAGTPAVFTRTLFAPKRAGSALNGAVSLGDYWRPNTGSSIFWLQYGMRMDFNHFLDKPLENPLVEQKLGVRNDNVSNKVYFSPRVGFQWIYGKQDQIAFVPGAARPPRALIQGGMGLFQNIQGVNYLSNAINNTGLASSTQSLTCLGPAAPTPNWSAYALNPSAIPSTCADGTNGSTFSNATPSVNMFSKNFEQTQSWRSNLNWSGPILDNRFALAVLGLYQLALNQPDAVDLNFSNTQRFALANEGGRPVFANIAAIDPTTGVVSSKDTRVTTDLLRVTETRSDLRQQAVLFQAQIKPITVNPYLRWTLGYQFQDAHDKYRGFTSTVGDPYATQWGLSQQPGRHAFSLTFASVPIKDVVYITWNLQLISGTPFTPSVSGDVNGDGFGNNDRAYVYDPATIPSSDSAFAAGMKSLLANGAPAAKKCLANQLSKLATRGSCMSPWTTSGSIGFQFNPQKIGLPKRATVNFTINNPLGIADLIVHGQDIHGWGQQLPPDPSLLFVRGFNPATKQFKYDVNQRFGSTRPNASTQRQLALVSLRVVIDIGTPREHQFLSQRLEVGRGKEGTKATAPTLKSMGSSTIPNPMALILQQPDSLKLTRKQADSLAVLSRLYTQKADAIWSPVAKDLEALPDKYNDSKAYDEYVVAREKTVDYLITLVPDVKNLLTGSQKRKLPQQILNYLDVRVLKFLRSSSSGDGAPFFIR